MMNARRLSSLFVCAIALPLGTGCGGDADTLDGNEAPVEKASCDETGSADAGSADAGDAGDVNASPAVKITNITASGSGCPAGSWSVRPAADGSGMEVSFDKFSLSAGPDKPSVQSLACNVSLKFDAPRGSSIAVQSVEYTGEAELAQGASAEIISNVAFTGVGTPSNSESVFNVPKSGPFTFVSKPRELYWSPCDITSNLQLRTRVVLNSTDRATGNVQLSGFSTSTIRFATRSCGEATNPLDGGLDGGATPDTGKPLPPVETPDGGEQPSVPPASTLPIVRVTPSGNSCSAQTAKTVIAPDGRSFTVSFDDLAVAAPSDVNAYCRLAIDVTAPKGKAYALEGFTGQASAELAAGASARIVSLTDFTGSGVDASKEKTTTFAGPLKGPVSFAETFSAQQLNFSRCDASPGSLGLRFRVLLQGASGSTDRFRVGQLGGFKFVQRDCP